MIKLYGSARSSAGRCYWMLEECGLKYEVQPLDMSKKEQKSESFLKLNPNGKVPVLDDNGFVIWESAAIIQYLAEKYKPQLLGATPEEKGLIAQWMFWAMTEVQPPVVEILIQKLFVPEDKRDLQLIEKRQAQLPNLLNILNKQLTNNKYLVAGRFTTADLTVGSVINTMLGLGTSLNDYPQIQAWFGEISHRPGFQKMAELRKH